MDHVRELQQASTYFERAGMEACNTSGGTLSKEFAHQERKASLTGGYRRENQEEEGSKRQRRKEKRSFYPRQDVMDVPYVFRIMACAYAASGEATPFVPLVWKKHEFLTIFVLNLFVGHGFVINWTINLEVQNNTLIIKKRTRNRDRRRRKRRRLGNSKRRRTYSYGICTSSREKKFIIAHVRACYFSRHCFRSPTIPPLINLPSLFFIYSLLANNYLTNTCLAFITYLGFVEAHGRALVVCRPQRVRKNVAISSIPQDNNDDDDDDEDHDDDDDDDGDKNDNDDLEEARISSKIETSVSRENNGDRVESSLCPFLRVYYEKAEATDRDRRGILAMGYQLHNSAKL
ncbi:hypothetical protein V1477_020300 [Vespula maculifrons]|uniref:Uncharacterized protein n=1 Tax=Vespula maculifrons TaxID=7453 RepID=A0ABD2ANP7_VESMC